MQWKIIIFDVLNTSKEFSVYRTKCQHIVFREQKEEKSKRISKKNL